MKKLKLPIITDSFWVFVASFFISYALIKYNGNSIILSSILSILTAVFCSAVFISLSIIIEGKKLLEKLDSENYLSIMDEFIFMPRDKLLKFFKNFYTQLDKDCVIKDNGILIEKEKVFILPIFKYEKISTNDVITEFINHNEEKLTIIGVEFNEELKKIVASKKLTATLIDGKTIYNKLKQLNLLPPITLYQIKKPPLKERLLKLIDKKYSKPAFILGSITLFTSTFVFFPIYYIVIGCLLLCYSLICKLFTFKDKSNDNLT